MNFDVFISYANQDKVAADTACGKLEAEGIRCWIAPRNVPPGAAWAGAIIDAIDHCRAMVVIFSSSANASKQIQREVQRAFEREVPVVPFRIENVAPEQSLAYYMESVHWLDAITPPLEQHLQKLAVSVKPFADTKTFGERENEKRGPRETKADKRTEIDRSQPPEQRKPWQPSRWSVLTVCVLGIVLVGSVGVWLAETHRPPAPPATVAVQPSPLPVTPEATPVQPPPASAQAPVSISGNWFDPQLSTSKIHILQAGNEFSLTGSAVVETGPLAGVAFDLSGSGEIIGNSLELNFSARFNNGLSVFGHCSGISRRDGLIALRCKDNNSFESTPTWIRAG
jgi:hypothetical protein